MTTHARPNPTIDGIAGLRRPVADLGRAVDFYCRALGFDPSLSKPTDGGLARLQLGSTWIELVAVDVQSVPVPAVAPDPRFGHAAIVTSDIDAAWQRLMPFRPSPITTEGPQRLPVGSGGVQAFKFRDPDGHPLELIAFPPGTGARRWHRSSEAITLGIDHFAIVVTDAERSIAFYAQHGFQVSHRQINRGVAQGRLDGLSAPVVEVIALAIPARPTPHLELLCYRQPAWQPSGAPANDTRRDVVFVAASDPQPDAHWIDPDGHEIRAGFM